MKKIALILTAATVATIGLVSCNGGSNKNEKVVDTTAVNQITAEVQAQIDSLAQDFGMQTMAHYGAMVRGDIKLSEKEKMVKITYLISPKSADITATMIQQYRLLGVMSVDYNMAKMYGNDVSEYETGMLKLITNLCDPAISEFREKLKNDKSDEHISQYINELYEDEVANNRVMYFWEYNGAVTIEATYLLSQNADKMITSFKDEDVAKLVKRIAILSDCVNRLVVYYPEMTSLQKSLTPLANLNATNVAELKDQLNTQKEQIEKSRVELLRFLNDTSNHE